MIFEGLAGIAVCGAFGAGAYNFFNFKRSMTYILQSLSKAKAGNVIKKWALIPALTFTLDKDRAEFFLVPGKRILWLLVTSEELKDHVGLWISEGKVLRGVVHTGNKEFDDCFTISTSANVTKNEALIYRQMTPEFQRALLDAKSDICAQIVNQFIEVFHPENSPHMMLKINNFAINSQFGKVRTEPSDISRFEKALSNLSDVYRVFRLKTE